MNIELIRRVLLKALENIDADLEHEYDDKTHERDDEMIAEHEATREDILAALKELDT